MTQEPCKYFGACGGCSIDPKLPYEIELAKKEEQLREIMGEYANITKRMIPAPSKSNYRNKMELAFGDEGKDGLLALGIRKRRSYYEVAVPDNCILIPDDFRLITLCVLNFFREAGETFFHRRRHTGALRHLVLRQGFFTGELLINLSTSASLNTPLDTLIDKLLNLPLKGRIVGFLHSVNDGVADVVKNENIHVLWGRDYYMEKLCGLDFKVSAFSFFQTNSAASEILYGLIRDFAQGNKQWSAYDLYCGTGTIAQILSPYFGYVIGIEQVPEAIEAAKINAGLNSIDNCSFYAGDVQAALDKFEKHPDVIVVDPPRNGLTPKALSKIIAISPKRLVYVACKPQSLARDMQVLNSAGFTPKKIAGLDMFPRTPHMEVVCLFEK